MQAVWLAMGRKYEDLREGKHQGCESSSLYIAPTRFTSSVLSCGLIGFPSVSETCKAVKFSTSPILAPAIYRS